MIDSMYWTCAELLSLGAQLGGAQDLPPPDVLSRRIASLLDEMEKRGLEAKIEKRDLDDARYAIVAFLDEQLFKAPWSGRQQWMLEPLQLTYFNENTAGEGFFTRLDAIEKEPSRVHVLEIYYLVLTLGFHGKYAVKGGDGVAGLVEKLGAALGKRLPSTEALSPHGGSPDPRRGRAAREAPVLLISGGVVTLAVLVFLVLRVVLSGAATDATRLMEKASGTSATQKGPAK
jgi:type VI secretion system protein ImpK